MEICLWISLNKDNKYLIFFNYFIFRVKLWVVWRLGQSLAHFLLNSSPFLFLCSTASYCIQCRHRYEAEEIRMGEVWVFLVFSPYFCADTAVSAFSFMILVRTGYPLSFFCSCMVFSALSFQEQYPFMTVFLALKLKELSNCITLCCHTFNSVQVSQYICV